MPQRTELNQRGLAGPVYKACSLGSTRPPMNGCHKKTGHTKKGDHSRSTYLGDERRFKDARVVSILNTARPTHAPASKPTARRWHKKLTTDYGTRPRICVVVRSIFVVHSEKAKFVKRGRDQSRFDLATEWDPSLRGACPSDTVFRQPAQHPAEGKTSKLDQAPNEQFS